MFYERYLLLCQGANQSPSSVAVNAGFSKGTVSVWKKKYEQSVDVRPEPDVIDKICNYFDCTEAWLLGIEDKQKENTATEDGSGIGLRTTNYDKLSDENKMLIDQMIEKLVRSQFDG